MKARDHALQLRTAIRNNDIPEYERLLKELEETCRLVAVSQQRKGDRLRQAFDKWKAVYLALRTRNGDLPPPEPFYYSGPYLTVLKTVIANRDVLGERLFRYTIAHVGNEALNAGATICVMFDKLYREQMNEDPRVAILRLTPKDNMDNVTRKHYTDIQALPYQLYNDYVYQTGYCTEPCQET